MIAEAVTAWFGAIEGFAVNAKLASISRADGPRLIQLIEAISFDLTLEVDADFADLDETKWGREQAGETKREWRARGGARELHYDYTAEHAYRHQEGAGTARLRRGLLLRVERAATEPAYADRRITFRVELGPSGKWHACVNLIPFIDGRWLGSSVL